MSIGSGSVDAGSLPTPAVRGPTGPDGKGDSGDRAAALVGPSGPSYRRRAARNSTAMLLDDRSERLTLEHLFYMIIPPGH